MPFTPYDAAAEALTVAAAALGADAPSTQFVTLDAPTLDCDMLVSYVSGLSLEEADAATATGRLVPVGPRQRRADLAVTYAVCVGIPQGADGAAWNAAIAAAAPLLISAGWRIFSALAGHDFGGCRARSVGPGVPLTLQGGIAGWSIPLTVDVE